MNHLNYTLFEEYKLLDKLCSEIYDDPHGVTRYIEDMKKVSPSIYRHLPNWQIDLEHLKLILHIRNYLAHTQGAFDETVCTEHYLDPRFLQPFIEAIGSAGFIIPIFKNNTQEGSCQTSPSASTPSACTAIFSK